MSAAIPPHISICLWRVKEQLSLLPLHVIPETIFRDLHTKFL